MSGYLQRLAQGASRPSANIRPVVNPLFSDLKPREGASFPVEENVTEIAGPAPLSHAGPTAPAESSRSDPAGHRAVPRLLPEVEAKNESRGNPVGEAGQIEGRSQPAANWGPVPAPSVVSHFLVASPERGEESGHRAVGNSDAGLESPRVETPGAREGGVRPGHLVSPLVPVIRGQPARTRGNPAAQAPRKVSGDESREPDEINIHIGRIEVTAVQPQAPGAAAPRARRPGTSLDEYLRQRDRRSP